MAAACGETERTRAVLWSQSMKKLGMIGGLGPESTIAYYRSIIAAGRERGAVGEYPPVLINSIDLQRVLQARCGQRVSDPDGLPRTRSRGACEG